MKIDSVWPLVLNITDSAEEKTNKAVPALRQLLILEATNAGVERDAGAKRSLTIVMHGIGKAETVDNRLRVLVEGPSLTAAKNTSGFHNVLYESAQEFLHQKHKHNTDNSKQRNTQGALSDTHKAALSQAACKTQLGDLDEVALRVVCPVDTAAGSSEVVTMMGKTTISTILFEVESTFATDSTGRSSGMMSLEKPVKDEPRVLQRNREKHQKELVALAQNDFRWLISPGRLKRVSNPFGH